MELIAAPPLPADYYKLTSEGRRRARVAAVARRSTPQEYVLAWSFFRNYYLNHPNAGFYKEFKESPPLHNELISFMRRYRLNGIASPRNTAKSTVIGTEVPLIELLTPSTQAIEVALVLSKDQFVEERFDKIMVQLQENERILSDFGVQKPTKGMGIWNRHQLRLNNHTTLKGYSVDGRKRGGRPDILIVDDPEFDPDTGTNIAAVNADLSNELLRVLMGMLSPTSMLYWIGTLLHRKSFLYHIVKSDDPKFTLWNRRLYEVDYTDAEGKTSQLWSARLTPEFLEQQRAVMGEGAYRAEYHNDPRSDTDPVLGVDSVVNEYHIATPEANLVFPQDEPDPLQCQTPIRWTDISYSSDTSQICTERQEPFCKVVEDMRRYMTVDYASTQDTHSDYSAIVIWGMDSRNTIWVLDAWQGKCRANTLLQTIWKYGCKWGVIQVAVEAVALQDEIRHQVSEFMGVMQAAGRWTPRVRGIRYAGGVSKGERIGSLEWRFNRGRIKLPSYLKRSHPFLRELYDQITSFTPDLSRLEHDDLVDALSMAHTVIPSGSAPVIVRTADRQTWQNRIEGGEIFLRENPLINLLHAFSPSEWTPAMMAAMETFAGGGPQQGPNRVMDAVNRSAPYLDPEDFYDNDALEYLV